MYCGYETYEQYLQSPEWREKKEEVFAEWGRRCCACGSEENLHVHHMDYIWADGKDKSQCRPLCGKCHRLVHATPEYITGRFGAAIRGLFDAIIANTMLVLWKGDVLPGSTTRLKGLILAEYERTGGIKQRVGGNAPAIYKANFSRNVPDRDFRELIDNTSMVWNLTKGEERNENNQ